MKKKSVSIILFYDIEENIILQDRKNFGGHKEKNETKEETIKREIQEELGLDINNLEDFRFFKHFHMKIYELDIELDREVFLAKIPKEVKTLKINEGGMVLIKFKDSFNLKMIPGDIEILKEIYKELK